MNEQLIRDLAEQAGIQMFEDRAFGWSVIAGTDHNVQRFAELIVRECSRVAMRSVDDAEPKEAWYLIEEHFGAEQ